MCGKRKGIKEKLSDMAKIVVQQTPVTVIADAGNDYICLTDMAVSGSKPCS